MGDRIFFKDEKSSWIGPFTQREAQEWYRKGWFDNSFPFYFAKSNEIPLDEENTGITLENLKCINGFESPFSFPSFFKVAEFAAKIMGWTRIEKPDQISDGIWKNFYELGNTVADFILDVFGAYGMGDFASWDKNRAMNIKCSLDKAARKDIMSRNIVLEYILVERMKEKEFFCCELCKESYFNYKQALIHFTSNKHWKKSESIATCKQSGIIKYYEIMNEFQNLPKILFEKDRQDEVARNTDGIVNQFSKFHLYPDETFLRVWGVKYLHPIIDAGESNFMCKSTESALKIVRSDIGRNAISELHEHLGKGKTKCWLCNCYTGDREGFYQHMESFLHLENFYDAATSTNRLDSYMLLIHVYRKELSASFRKKEAPKPAEQSETSSDYFYAPLEYGTLLPSAFVTPTPISKRSAKTIAKPKSIADNVWQRFYELGNTVADFVLDAFEVYGSGDFASWDKNRVKNMESTLGLPTGKEKIERNLVCEYILVERMKEEEFFCCDLCQLPLFNYKHALIHLTLSLDGEKKNHRDNAAARESGIDGIQGVLKSFTNLPDKLLTDDLGTECQRALKNGFLTMSKMDAANFRRCEEFHNNEMGKYNPLVLILDPATGRLCKSTLLEDMQNAVGKVKSDIGREALDSLHGFLTRAPPHCVCCRLNTGDREGFYAHYRSYSHLKEITDFQKKYFGPLRFDVITVLVNVLKKE